ncbi:proton myo-inositol cotransporter [Delitschia confertaspora ATCC 74209]|uniref:Proton myo-inositol cotransporter n=1 Tax=Delitschia confertaspora ATCC 74209 TaxID=1513339 RepID=A0A9P4MV79_9PLEO|nr:proton myo-inositol cotransporter [Delitschia confertaspora ATCC 74209]
MGDSLKEKDNIAEHIEFASPCPTVVIDNDLSLWQALRKYRKVVWYCVGLTSAILLYGFDYVIVGSVSAMPSFQQDFGTKYSGKWILPSSWLALWNLSSPLGAMLGAVLGGWFQDRVGRRVSLATGSLLSALAVAVCYVSYLPDAIDSRRGLFFAGKLIQGGAIGMVMATTQTYKSEILPSVLRGPIMAFFPVFTLLGQLIGAIVIYVCLGRFRGYTVCFASQWPFSVVPMIVAVFIPESPTYLVRKGRLEEALKSQQRITEDNVNPQMVVQNIQSDIEREKREARSTYKECFQAKNLRRTTIIMFANMLPNLFGLTLLAKASYFMQVVGMGSSTSVLFLILGIVLGLLSNIVSVWVTSRYGRRPLIYSTLSVAAVLWLGMGIAGCWSGVVTIWYTAITMMLVITICSLGVWPCSYALGSETSSLHLRAKSQGIGWFISSTSTAVWGVALPYIFNPDQGDLKAKTGFIFAATCAAAAVVSWCCVPEMKGRSAREIDRMFELGLGAREFGGYVGEEGEGDERRRRQEA